MNYTRNSFTSGAFTYKPFANDVPDFFSSLKCTPFNLQLPISDSWSTAKNRLLIVVGHIDSPDLSSKKLLSSQQGVVLTNLIRKTASDYASMSGKRKTFALAAINLHAFKTYHLDTEDNLLNTANKTARIRLAKYVHKLDPTHILVLGDRHASVVLGESVQHVHMKRGWVHEIRLGGAIRRIVTTIDISKTYFIESYSNADADEFLGDEDSAIDNANLLGYVSRNMLSLFFNKLPFSISDVVPKPVLLNTKAKVEQFFTKLEAASVVATDTEASNLNVLDNKLITAQFAFSATRGYILPVDHKDSPFDASYKLEIKKRLRAWLMRPVYYNEKDRKYLIVHNAKFDYRLYRSMLGIPIILWPLWDTIAGLFCFHPDTYVLIEDGSKRKIKDLVHESNPPKVLSFNVKTNQVEAKPLLHRSEHTTNKRMVEVDYGSGSVVVTEDHKIWSVTRQSYVEAGLLTEDDVILMHE